MENIITNVIIIAVILAIVALAVFYIIKAKKSGKKCIGCPDSGSCCAKKGEGGCSCCTGCSQGEK